MFECTRDQHNYNTRHANSEYSDIAVFGSKAFKCVDTKIWNSFPDDVRSSDSISFFKMDVKTFYLIKLKE